MKKSFIKFNKISFQYPDASRDLFKDLSIHLSKGWTGVIGANGSGKSTLMKLASSLLKPDSSNIEASGSAFYCPQRTDDMPGQFEELLGADDRRANIVKYTLEINPDWIHRWDTLSHGERKRSQLASALWQRPDILCIDEPTNHLDSYARGIIIKALKDFKGAGLLVSHDRELLDSLCSQCLFIHPPEVVLRPGGITSGMEQDKKEQTALRKLRKEKKKEYKRLYKEKVNRKKIAEGSDSRKSKRNISRKDHDAKSKIDLARLSGKDATGGKLLKQMESRLDRARNDMDNIKYRREYTSGIRMPSSVSKRDYLLHIPMGSLSLGDMKILNYSDIYIGRKDRIALTGRNGSGKSTLIRHIVSCINVSKEKSIYIPQEIDIQSSQELLCAAKKPAGDKLGHLMTIISRLGSRPDRLLESSEPSPGEMRKLMLALGMLNEPHIIIMDEPTNHMDLVSIECLEAALNDISCALLLVSHDRVFLENLTSARWDIREDDIMSGIFNLYKEL